MNINGISLESVTETSLAESIHPDFVKYKSHILTNLAANVPINPLHGMEYHEWEEKQHEFTCACITHATGFNRPIQTETAIVITHPFYPLLDSKWRDYLKGVSDTMQEEFKKYLANVNSLFLSGVDRTKIRLVVFEDPTHYAMKTAYDLEQGLLDTVILTTIGSGEPYERYDMWYQRGHGIHKKRIGGQYQEGCLNQLVGRHLAFGGSFVDKCLRQTIKFMKGREKYQEVWALYDLILAYPKGTTTLITSTVAGVEPTKVITLDEFLTMR